MSEPSAKLMWWCQGRAVEVSKARSLYYSNTGLSQLVLASQTARNGCFCPTPWGHNTTQNCPTQDCLSTLHSFQAQMVRRVKAYLKSMKVITDEEELHRMSLEVEPPSGGLPPPPPPPPRHTSHQEEEPQPLPLRRQLHQLHPLPLLQRGGQEAGPVPGRGSQ